MARDLGVDLRTVHPTGPGGTVTREDVRRAAETGPELRPTSTGHVHGRRAEMRLPIKGVRKATAEAMVASAFTAPHVTEWLTVDATRSVELMARLRTRTDFQIHISPLLIVAKAMLLAIRRTPIMNASWDEAAGEIVLRHGVNLGIAVSTPRGLLVPNVKDADQLTLAELASALVELTDRARAGKIRPADLAGGTVTLTNIGVFGVDGGTPILNPGEASILAVGAIKPMPWVVDGTVVARQVTTLAVSFDHRLVDGAEGSRFLADVGALLHDPAEALQY